MSCERCERPVVVIQMELTGTEAAMRSCTYCDTRRWSLDGNTVGLDDVLAAVPSRRAA
jgi:hypothetical protein